MKKNVFSILVVLSLAYIFFVFHTSRATVRNELLLAESLMTEHPDSSISILQNISDSRSFKEILQWLYKYNKRV